MNKQIEELLPDGTMRTSYELPSPEKIQLSLAFLDEFGLPMERRGYSTRIPVRPEDKATLAKSLGEMAEKTARFMMGLSNAMEEGK